MLCIRNRNGLTRRFFTVPSRLAAALLLLAFALPSGARAGLIELLDENLDDADWTRQVLINEFNVTSFESAMNAPASGNPDAYRHSEMDGTRNTLVNGTTAPRMQIGHFYTGEAWNPSADGAIDDFAISYDAAAFDDRPPGQVVPTGRTVRFGFVVRQGGVVYRPVANLQITAHPDDTWNMLSGSAFDETDFTPFSGGPSTLDLTTSGTPIEFGYYVFMSSTSLVIDNEMGVDNFRVVINANVVYNEADFDTDGDVDGDDFLAWQGGFGTTNGAMKSDGDYDNDGDVDGDDFLGWQANFGMGEGAVARVPEPGALGIVVIAAIVLVSTRRRFVK